MSAIVAMPIFKPLLMGTVLVILFVVWWLIPRGD